jgi:hypothetical protein
MLSTPNFFRLEIAYSELEVYQRIMDPPFDVANGFFYRVEPAGPGSRTARGLPRSADSVLKRTPAGIRRARILRVRYRYS